jgi:hypothetical protein
VIVVTSKEVAMAGRKIRDSADARACIKAANAANGVSLGEWAREHGIDGRSLTAWKNNLGRRSRRTARRVPARLVELVAAPAANAAHVRYVVHCGVRAVEVDARFDEETLRRLLRVLASC